MAVDPVTLLRANGPLPASRLAERMGASRPTLSRAVRQAGGALIVRGQARRTTYAARRALRGSLDPLPLFRIDRIGTPHHIADLDLVCPDGTAVDFIGDFGWPLDDRMNDGWFDGIPYPMQDMRPQGFLGRNFARHHAAMLQVKEDPTTWSDDDALYALSILGQDVPGDLLVGAQACRLWLDRVQETTSDDAPGGVPDSMVADEYSRRATYTLVMGVLGSSIGGEFPKFPAIRQRADGTQQHMLVKFSGADDSPGTRRWADLLVCEHLAGRALRDTTGIDCAKSEIHVHAGRTFLEVERFDRHGALGRSPMVSWFALNAAFVGDAGRPWAEAVRPLLSKGWLAADDVDRIRRTWLFGQLIGNTDMHDGNLSFIPVTDGDGTVFTVAPIYDMLPMTYAPVRGVELPPRSYVPRLPLPAEAAAWRDAAAAALVFWALAANDDRISAEFRRTCSDNEALLRRLVER